jgi:hypothetical protein
MRQLIYDKRTISPGYSRNCSDPPGMAWGVRSTACDQSQVFCTKKPKFNNYLPIYDQRNFTADL